MVDKYGVDTREAVEQACIVIYRGFLAIFPKSFPKPKKRRPFEVFKESDKFIFRLSRGIGRVSWKYKDENWMKGAYNQQFLFQ